MSKIDFVPDEYVQQRESNRANLMYLGLLILVLAGMGVTFSLLKARQSKVNEDVARMDKSLSDAQGKIALLEELEKKGNDMMKTALITAELPDLVGKSVILATLTNTLPEGVSLTDISITDKEVKIQDDTDTSKKTQFQKAKDKNKKDIPVKVVKDTQIELSGTARNDIEVANYIASLGESFLVRSVGLVESTQFQTDDLEFRRFKLNVMLKRDAKVTKEYIESIRNKRNEKNQASSFK